MNVTSVRKFLSADRDVTVAYVELVGEPSERPVYLVIVIQPLAAGAHFARVASADEFSQEVNEKYAGVRQGSWTLLESWRRS